MKTKNWTMMALGTLACCGLVQAAEVVIPAGPQTTEPRERNHSLYVGFGFGPTQLKPGNDTRSVEGIDFKLTASNNNMGGETHVGYWLTDYLAIEVGGRDYGQAKVPFSFSDPHDNTTGTGESKVGMRGFNVSLVLGVDVTPKLQLFARAGVLQWTETFDSRFDIPGQSAMHRNYTQSGAGMCLGAGLNYRFENYWNLQVQYEHNTFDIDQVSMFSIGIGYDFLGLMR